MHNYIVKYPGKKDGIIVLASHYETNYPLRDIEFYGANDGAATTALLIEIGNVLRAHPPEGYSVWLVFDDGEEAIKFYVDRLGLALRNSPSRREVVRQRHPRQDQGLSVGRHDRGQGPQH